MSAGTPAPHVNVSEMLAHIRRKGVKLWQEDGTLRFAAPKGTLSVQELDQLKTFKAQIVSFLRDDIRTMDVARVPRSTRAPLAFTQQSDWQFMRLGELRRMRQIASATHLNGGLEVATLRASVAEMVRRHEALRTRIVVVDEVPAQEIDEVGRLELEVDDLSAVPGDSRDETLRGLIDSIILAPVDEIEASPCAIRLVRLADQEHALIIAMDHLVSDAYSMSVLLRELLTTYAQRVGGRTRLLPAISIQFPAYALSQQASRKAWEDEHLAYWSERLQGCGRLMFPVGEGSQPNASGWSGVPLEIDAKMRAELLGWCRSMRTTLVLAVFTAYLALVLRWCGTNDAVVQFQTDGRLERGLRHTVGYFASVLHLRLQLLPSDTFVDLLSQATREYCLAYQHADCSYLAARVPRPDIVRSTMFNWVPEEDPAVAAGSAIAELGLASRPFPFENPALRHYTFDRDPVIQLFDDGAEVTGGVFFPLRRFAPDAMRRFAGNFLMMLRQLLRNPEQTVQGIMLE